MAPLISFDHPTTPRNPLDHLVVAGAVAAIACLEVATGDTLEASGLFLLPVLWITRRGGATTGATWSILISALWFGLDRAAQTQTDPLVLGVNHLIRLGVNLTVVRLLSWLDEARRTAVGVGDTDALTEVPNRRGFWKAAERLLAGQRRDGTVLTAACLDLDGFKALNDSRGHHVGDEALRVFARVLRKELRDTDLCGRLGGDEFVVLLPGTSAAHAEVALARLHGALSLALSTISPELGVSAGAVTFTAPAGSIDELLHQADAAMYRIKRDGKRRLGWVLHRTAPVATP